MDKIKVKEGQIWKGSDYGIYVVTKEYRFEPSSNPRFDLINRQGIAVEGIGLSSFEEDTFIAEYPNWLEAVKSEHFNKRRK